MAGMGRAKPSPNGTWSCFKEAGACPDLGGNRVTRSALPLTESGHAPAKPDHVPGNPKSGDSPRRAEPSLKSLPGRAPDWTCLVKGPNRAAALRALDETSPVWPDPGMGFRAGSGRSGRLVGRGCFNDKWWAPPFVQLLKSD